MENLTELFCTVDDFCKLFLPEWNKHLLSSEIKKRNRASKLSISELMTIMIAFHQSHYRNFKNFYTGYVMRIWQKEFPNLVSYNRFVELQSSTLMPLCFFVLSRQATKTGLYFVDSTTLKVCHVKRANRNKVFKGVAKLSKSTMGWYFGFKLHLIINDMGELIAFRLTSGTTDDRAPVLGMSKNLIGKLFGDKGYISKKLFSELYNKGLQLITNIKKNMKNKLMPIFDKIMLRKRSIIETVNDQLKNISQIEHSRHRSVVNFLVNLIAGLGAYALREKKPSLGIKNALMVV